MEKKTIKIALSRGDVGYASWIPGYKITSIEEADLVIFEGGEDVNPAIYGARTNGLSGFNQNRDLKDINNFALAKKLNKKCLGICRGLS